MWGIDWAMSLEYLKVIFSWPPVLALFLYWFVRRFTEQISDLIGKIKGFKLPGGSEVMLAEKEQQQENALPPRIDFPGPSDQQEIGKGHVDLSIPSPTLEAHDGPPINVAHFERAKGLYPTVDPVPVAKWMHENPGPAFEDYVDKVFQLHCERTFNIIFGTQVQVLEFLGNPTLTSPSPSATLVPLYERHTALTGRSERTLSEFLGFLVVRGLVENVGTVEGPLYRITQAGREFLQHIKQYYPLQWNSKYF